LPTDSAAASPADVQIANVSRPRSVFNVFIIEHPENTSARRRKCWDDICSSSVNIAAAVGRRNQNGGGTYRHRKRQRIAEAIGEKQLCGDRPTSSSRIPSTCFA